MNTIESKKGSQENGSKEPHCDFNTLNTNDLEDLIEAKKHKMDQLKAEEHSLLRRKRKYAINIAN